MLPGASGRQCRRCRSHWAAELDRCPDCGGSLGAVRGSDTTEVDPTLVPDEPAESAEPPARAPRLGKDLTPGTLVGDYLIEGKLGEGGMGTVYAATHPVIGKQAAVKVLKAALCSDADGVERFLREARAINQIRHPSIVDVFAFGTLDDGRTYLVMERLQGETLDARLRRGRLSVSEVADILLQIIRPLAAAHLEGIVHRDLKPENVFLVDVPGEEAQQVKLLDFGLAKLTGRDNVRTTRTGQTLGTPVYMSPEQVNGQEVDHRSDVYSLGVMAFEMLAGEWPFLAESTFQLMLKHVQEEPPDLRTRRADAPARLAELVARMLSKQRTERPSLSEIRALLTELRAGPRVPAPVQDEPSTSAPTVPMSAVPMPALSTPAVPAPAAASPLTTAASPSVDLMTHARTTSAEEPPEPRSRDQMARRRRIVGALLVGIVVAAALSLVAPWRQRSATGPASAPLAAPADAGAPGPSAAPPTIVVPLEPSGPRTDAAGADDLAASGAAGPTSATGPSPTENARRDGRRPPRRPDATPPATAATPASDAAPSITPPGPPPDAGAAPATETRRRPHDPDRTYDPFSR